MPVQEKSPNCLSVTNNSESYTQSSPAMLTHTKEDICLNEVKKKNSPFLAYFPDFPPYFIVFEALRLFEMAPVETGPRRVHQGSNMQCTFLKHMPRSPRLCTRS
jgi:hypothetical protein